MGRSRKANFELLRIISMLLIIGYHFCSETSANIFQNSFSSNQFYAFCIGSWGLVGVHCFFFISAYFLIKKNAVHSEKVFKIIFQTLFYSVVAIVLDLLLGGGGKWKKIEILYHCIAPLMGQYWFVLVYCMMYILSPYFNIFLKNVKASQLKKCMLLLTLIVPVLLTLWGESPCGTLGIAIYDYFLVALIEKKVICLSKRKVQLGLVVTIFVVLITETFGSIVFGKPIAIVRLTGRCAGIQILIAFFLFLLFLDLRVTKVENIISLLSQNTLGVYLIHESPLMGKYLRDDLLGINKLYLAKSFPISILIMIIITFIVATVLDKIRTITFEKIAFIYLRKINIFPKIDCC